MADANPSCDVPDDDDVCVSADERKLNDIFEKMCRATSDEERELLAAQLRAAVDAVPTPSEPSFDSSIDDMSYVSERGPAITTLSKTLQYRLISSSLPQRLAAIAAVTALINTETETIYARTQRTANAVRLLFSRAVPDMPTAKASSSLVSTLADVDSPLAQRAVDYVLSNAINIVVAQHPDTTGRLAMDRARAAMVITELASIHKAPKFVLKYRAYLLEALWDVIWNEDMSVREQGVHSMQAILKTFVVRAEESLSQATMSNVVDSILQILRPYAGSVARGHDASASGQRTATSSPTSSPTFVPVSPLTDSADPSQHAFPTQAAADAQPVFEHASQSPPTNLPDAPTLDAPDAGRSPNGPTASPSQGSQTPSVIHGSLCLLGALIESDQTRPYLHHLAFEICNISLTFQTHPSDLVRGAVAEILPLLVRLNRATMSDDFLDKVHQSTMRLIQSKDIPRVERGRSLVSLSNIWEQAACEEHEYMLRDMLEICRRTLSCPSSVHEIPLEAVLSTISHLANVSRGNKTFELTISQGLLRLIFGTSFTSQLVETVDCIRRAIPSLDTTILNFLVNVIAATLKKGLPDKRTGSAPDLAAMMARTASTSVLANANRPDDDRTVPRTHSDIAIEARRSSLSSGPMEFFKQYPFSSELHRIDSSSSLASKSWNASLDGFLEGNTVKSLFHSDTSEFDLYNGKMSTDKNDSPCVALKAIINYEFGGMRTTDFASFASEYVIGYVESNSVKIRALSVGASAKLMESAVKVWRSTKRASSLTRRLPSEVQTVLVQLVLVAVSDPSKDVRYVAIRSIDRKEFWPYLLQPEVLSTLFMCLHDESLGMQNAALSLIGRLGKANPAYVLPALRSFLNHLLTTLRLDGRHFSRARKEATELIVTLVHNAQYFVDPYMGVLMDALIVRLEESRKSHDTETALPVLLTLAKMGGTISRHDLKPHKDALVPLVVSYVLEVQGADVLFRRAALRALAALVQNTGSAIRPYVEHPNLLPRLLEILRSETDQKVRLDVGALIGSLGAVGPDDHKYAALPIFSVGGRLPNYGRGGLGDSQGRSSLRGASNTTRASPHWAGPGSQRSDLGSGLRSHSGHAHPHSSGIGEHRHGYSGHDRDNDYDERASSAGYSYSGEESDEDQQTSLTWFSLGGVRLKKRLRSHVPEWSRDELEYVSLVGKLDHPFTQNEDYFPSVLLDELHKLISSPRPRYHLREACQALVNILKSVGPRCTHFLPEVVPRMHWLIDHLTKSDPLRSAYGAKLKQFTVLMLAEIVTHAGQSFLPYAFDTILLAWNYFRYVANCPLTTAGFCLLLTRVRESIGDEFKAVIPTIVPLLLETLGEDKSPKGMVACAVLGTLESFCPLLENCNSFVLQGLTEMFNLEKSLEIRLESLLSLIRIVKDMDYVNVLSSVVHPLVVILAGVSSPNRVDLESIRSTRTEGGEQETGTIRNMAVLSAIALYEIGVRSPRGFRVYVPVVTKALRISSVKRLNPLVYACLRSFLYQRSPEVVNDLLDDSNDSQLLAFGPAPALPENLIPPRQVGLSELQRSLRLQAIPNQVNIVENILKQKWEVESHFKGDDWTKWISDLGVALFQQSGCPSFRACVRISESIPSFTNNLLNPAFLSCWSSPISEATKSQICLALDTALSSRTIPLNVLQAILNLFEFMDHDEKPLRTALQKLSSTAHRCGALAKSLRYREQDYIQNHGRPERMLDEIEGDDGLIAIYEKINHIESAVGTISHYEKMTVSRLQEQWYEKLQRWDTALEEYDAEIESCGPVDDIFNHHRKWPATLGSLRCLNQMGRWRSMISILDETRANCSNNRVALQQLALDGKGLSVSFDLGLWEEFEDWLKYIDLDSYDGCFYRSILHIKRGKDDPAQLALAEECIAEAGRHLDLELTARVSEGYPRAYSHIVRSQSLVEMKEMISYLRSPVETRVFDRQRLVDVWNKRLAGCKRDRQTWNQVLSARTLVLDPMENKGQWLEYAIMCRKAKLLPMASEVLQRLVRSYVENSGATELTVSSQQPAQLGAPNTIDLDSVPNILSIQDLDLKFACIKHLWAKNERLDAYRALEHCRDDFLTPGKSEEISKTGLPYNAEPVKERKPILAAEVFSKLSKWGNRLCESGNLNPSLTDPLVYAELAVKVSPNWYKSWHYWAVMNCSRFETAIEKRLEDARRRLRSVTQGQVIGGVEKRLLTEAVRGFFQAINLCGKSRLEDSLKVLTLWFKYGGHANMHVEFNRGFDMTNIARWLEVVPQIIARLHTPYTEVQAGVKNLLTRIGKAHPHVAVYPLTVAKSMSGLKQVTRSQAASEILEELKKEHFNIVVQTEMVARELVRVAILWTEMWYEKLEEASKLYYVERDVDGMIETLAPLHAELQGTIETEYERQFVSELGQELGEAAELCANYTAERQAGARDEILGEYINQAWLRYTNVFKKLQRHQAGMHELNLKTVSNGLYDARDLALAVPGTYDPDEGVAAVSIAQFTAQLHVLQSKQRPRKLSIIGSNGHEYQFLLKGHEDLRQDERVMQVFGLINKLFAKSEQRALLNDVGLKTYSVIALSADAGLIEWVPDCDTMHSLVKNFREMRRIVPNIEHRVMLRCAPEPERLTLLQKVELFEYMLQSTSGGDLSRVLWLRSRNSEMWLDRRTVYAKSLAITSMVGYLLGLGDRHPSNLMIERLTGKIMHIDFGDCFEVAQKREKYPERVPFRLTRMMVNVLEPCGVEGFFRHTSVATLDVLRQKNAKESLMSMMEAFVYDPLIRWKLLGADELTQLQKEGEAAATATATSSNLNNINNNSNHNSTSTATSTTVAGPSNVNDNSNPNHTNHNNHHNSVQAPTFIADRRTTAINETVTGGPASYGGRGGGAGPSSLHAHGHGHGQQQRVVGSLVAEREVPRDISELVQSLSVTGSLSESLRLQSEREARQAQAARAAAAAAASSNHGNGGNASGTTAGSVGIGIATPRRSAAAEAAIGRRADDMFGTTPNAEARYRQSVAFDKMVQSLDQLTDVIHEVSNDRAQEALNRFSAKLAGTDFDTLTPLNVSDQVDRLVHDARNVENLCTLFLGWCAFW